MNKILFIFTVILISSCSSKNCSNFRGCEYEIKNSLFSKDTEITINGKYSPMDVYIIILDEIINDKPAKGVKINLSSTNIKYLSKEDVSYIKCHTSKINEYENMFSMMKKSSIVADRISVYESK